MLLHGVATSRLIWRRVIGAARAARRRVIAVDVPGFGESAPAGPGFELDAVADRLVGGLGLERFDLVGHSLGGAVAVAAAARHPDARAPARARRRPPASRRARRASRPRSAPRAERAVHARRGARLPGSPARRARRAMFGTTVADAGRLHPDDARLLLDASDGARRVARRRPPGARGRPARRPRGRADAGRPDLGRADRVVPYAGLDALRRLRPDAPSRRSRHRAHPAGRAIRPRSSRALERILAALRPTRRLRYGRTGR